MRWAFGAMLACVNFGLCCWWLLAARAESAAPAPVSRPSESARDPADIAELRKLDLNALCDSLQDFRQNHRDLLNCPLSDGMAAAEVRAQVCLHDRRVCRMYDLLASMRPEEAADACRRLFDERLRLKEESWARRFRKLRTEGKSEFLMGDYQHQLSSLALLSAFFCDGPTVVDQVTCWKLGNVAPQVEALMLEGIGKGPGLQGVQQYGEPDDLFIAHLFLVALEKPRGLNPELLLRARWLGLPPERKVPVFNWTCREAFHGCSRNSPTPRDSRDIRQFVTLTEPWGNREQWSIDARYRVIHYLSAALMHTEPPRSAERLLAPRLAELRQFVSTRSPALRTLP